MEWSIEGVDLRLEVEERPEAGSWRVLYTFSRPVAGLLFLQQRTNFRAGNWTMAPPESGGTEALSHEWCQIGDREGICPRPLGRETTRFALEFASDFSHKTADYDLNIPFTDGGQLLYTGYLIARPLVCPPPRGCKDGAPVPYPGPLHVTWVFRTRPERNILVGNRVARGSIRWSPRPGVEERTYVYFGPVEPLRTPHATLLMDPGMPGWMLERMATFLPEIFAYYREKTRVELAFRPVVLVSYLATEARGFAFSGGTLPGLIQLAVQGRAWATEDDRAKILWFQHLAHEAFHLWNGQMFQQRLGPTEEWLSEGSADYFALVALHHFGLIDQRLFEKGLVETANRCIARLRGQPLLRARKAGNYEGYYSCGATLQFLVDQKLQRATGGRVDLFNLFAHLFDRATRRDGTYSTFDYLEAVQWFTADPLAVAPVAQVLHLGLPAEAETFFHRELAAAGLPVSLAPLSEATLDLGTLRSLIQDLLARCRCLEKDAVEWRSAGIRLQPGEGCRSLPGTLEITHLDGFHLLTQPARAYSNAIHRVQNGEALVLTAREESEKLPLQCPQEAVDTSFTLLLRWEPGKGRDGVDASDPP